MTGRLAQCATTLVEMPEVIPSIAGAPLRVAVIGMRGVPHVIGGIETHCAQLYPALAEAADLLDIHLLARRPYVSQRRFDLGRITVWGLWSPRKGASETAIHTVRAILYARFRLHAAVVHLHGIGPGFFAPLTRMLGMRTVVTDHASDFERPRWGIAGRTFLRAGEKLAARFADRIICVSQTLQDEFLNRNPAARARTVVIRHGVALEPVLLADAARLWSALGLERGRYLLAVGRFDETKRFEDAIAAARAAKGVMPLVIVGAAANSGSSYEARLRALAGPETIFTGFRTGADLTALYHGAALLVHPSEMEGFGLVILEALTAGVRPLVSDLPVHREFGLPEECYVALGDVPALAAAFAAVVPRDSPWPLARTIASRDTLADAVAAHLQIIRELSSPAA